jgi:hypothetical protein
VFGIVILQTKSKSLNQIAENISFKNAFFKNKKIKKIEI